MADFVQTDSPITVIATTYKKIGTIPSKNGQFTIATDRGLVCFDNDGKRSFMHGIECIDWDAERVSKTDPVEGKIYFVLDTAIFWTYQGGEWKPLTHKPEDVVYIGVSLPETGKKGTLYVDRSAKNIAVWDVDTGTYDMVANYCDLSAATNEDILKMFNN